MDILFHIDPTGNFGDDLNEWLWDRILPGWRGWSPNVTLVGVGTLLSAKRLEEFRGKSTLVLGSGTGYGRMPDLPLCADWDIRFVRGPQTASALGLETTKAVTDPAALLSDLPEFRDVPKSGGVVFVPHHRTVDRHDWNSACDAVGIEYVSPQGEARDVIRRIAAADRVVAESLHAAIIADTFRVPWVPLRVGGTFNCFKWKDWMESLEMNNTVTPLFPSISFVDAVTPMRRFYRVRHGARLWAESLVLVRALRRSSSASPACLSCPEVLSRRKAQMWQILDEVTRDYGA